MHSNLKEQYARVMSCHVCGSMDSIEICTYCEEPICPRHRAGTGMLSEGYTCVGEGTANCTFQQYIPRRIAVAQPTLCTSAMAVVGTKWGIGFLTLVIGFAGGFILSVWLLSP